MSGFGGHLPCSQGQHTSTLNKQNKPNKQKGKKPAQNQTQTETPFLMRNNFSQIEYDT